VKEVFWLRWVLTSLVASLRENHHPFLKMAEDEVGYLLDKETVRGTLLKLGMTRCTWMLSAFLLSG